MNFAFTWFIFDRITAPKIQRRKGASKKKAHFEYSLFKHSEFGQVAKHYWLIQTYILFVQPTFFARFSESMVVAHSVFTRRSGGRQSFVTFREFQCDQGFSITWISNLNSWYFGCVMLEDSWIDRVMCVNTSIPLPITSLTYSISFPFTNDDLSQRPDLTPW